MWLVQLWIELIECLLVSFWRLASPQVILKTRHIGGIFHSQSGSLLLVEVHMSKGLIGGIPLERIKCVHGLLFMNVFFLMKAYMLKCVTVLDFMLELHFERGGTDEKTKLCNAKKEKKRNTLSQLIRLIGNKAVTRLRASRNFPELKLGAFSL